MTFEPIKIGLSKPIQHGRESITEVVFKREMEAGDMFDMPTSRKDITLGHVAVVAARLTELELPIIKRLAVPDFQRVMEVAGAFLPSGQETETEPSDS